MSALRRILKVKGGYEVTVSCTKKPTLTAFYRTYEQCGKFADNYFLDYLGVQLKSIHHPEGDGVEPDGVNPESLETVEIEIPMNKRLKELSRQAGFKNWGYDEELERFAELVRQDEREICAKLCEEVGDKAKDNDGYTIGGYACAKAIRARKEST
jgi:hypothetical protein